MGLILAMLVAMTVMASAQDEPAQLSSLTRTYPLPVRCGLIKAVFAPDAFDELFGYLRSSCASRARLAGKARVVPYVIDDPSDDTAPVRFLFGPKESCESNEFVVLNPSALSHVGSDTIIIDMTFTKVHADTLDLGVGVVVLPNGIVGCTNVSARVSRRHGKWQIRKPPAEASASP